MGQFTLKSKIHIGVSLHLKISTAMSQRMNEIMICAVRSKILFGQKIRVKNVIS